MTISELASAAMACFAPPPTLTVSEWADRYRFLSPEASAEPGKWSTSRAPYQRGIMDAVSDPEIDTVALMTSAQIGKTAILENIMAFFISQDPSPILLLQPTLEMAATFSKDRLAPMLRDTPTLHGLVKDARARDSGNTQLHKALCIDTPIATPTGWKTMGEITIGDFVFGDDGKPTKVTHVTPIEDRESFELFFSDNCSVIADDDHLWFVEEWKVIKTSGRAKQTRVVSIKTTKEIRTTLKKGERNRYFVPFAKPIDLPENDLAVDPYILGAWLGDGFSHSPFIVAGINDEEIVEHLKNAGAFCRVDVGSVLKISLDDPSIKRGNQLNGRFVQADPTSFRARLRSAGVMTHRGGNGTLKHIPDQYLRASVSQRISLLQGLMDTDGSIRKDGWCVFTTANTALRDGVSELLSTLGVTYRCVESNGKYVRKNSTKEVISWRLEFQSPTFDVFRLSRKKERQVCTPRGAEKLARRRITSVIHAGVRKVRCISVDNKSKLYLAGKKLVPTHNSFPGGHVTMTGANSPANLASRPIRVVLCDEVDRYPESAGTEGDPVSLARKRTATFWNRKVVLTSTPTIKGLSRIEQAFEQSDKRRYWLPCPECGEFQTLKWAGVKWDEGKPESAAYYCEHCGARIGEENKPAMLAAGEWRSDGDFTGTAGFHLNELYSPWRRWAEIAADFIEAKHAGTETLKVWVNTSLGETWEEQGDAVEIGGIMSRVEQYQREDHAGKPVTGGVDVQKDRLEVSFVAWAEGEEAWLLDHVIIPGDTARAEPWEELAQVIAEFRPGAVAVDSGFNTSQVYEFVSRRRFCYAIKGQPGFGRPLIEDARKRAMRMRRRRGVHVEPVGVDGGKQTIHSRLRHQTAGPGYIHFPDDPAFDQEYFDQLAAEKLITKYRFGRPHQEWQQIRPRNEALDCLVYALAALRLAGLRLDIQNAAASTQGPTVRRIGRIGNFR